LTAKGFHRGEEIMSINDLQAAFCRRAI
jgi:hypothetical protein